MSKTKTLLAAAMALALAAPVAASEALRQITVTGEARAEAAPDMAVITLGASEQAAEAAQAMAAVSQVMAEVTNELRSAGIAPEDMQTQEISLSPVWSQRSSSGDRKITGFVASSMLTLRLRDLERVGEVLDQVLDAGANRFRGLRFDLSDPQEIEDSLRSEAVEDAIRKARQLAEASGMVLGPVRSIDDLGSGGGHPQPMMMEMARSSAVPVEAGSLGFSYSVNMVFDISAPE